MMKKAIYKVPNGKLLKIFLEEHDGKIAQIKITGDFFMYPEEHVEIIEAALVGCVMEKSALESALQNFLTTHPTKFFGLDTESLVHTMLVCRN